MKILQTVYFFAMCLPLTQSSDPFQALHQFRKMILCVLPNSWPIAQFADYGCYCGYGGSGTPVDDLDRCCQVHDNCYGDAEQHHDCTHFWDKPYTKIYNYHCDEETMAITCKDNNNTCARFICECDQRAAECFAVSPWIPEHQNLPSDQCK